MSTDCGTVEVIEPTTQSDISLSNCSVSPQQVNPGDEVSVTGTVTNNGSTAADVTITLTAAGRRKDSLTRTMKSGESVTVEFIRAPQTDVSYSINVGSVSA